VKWENYTKHVQIEARVLGDLAQNHIIPICTFYQTRLIKNVKAMQEVFPQEKAVKLCERNMALIEEIATRTDNIERYVSELIGERKVANKIDNQRDRAIAYHDRVAPIMDKIRYEIDHLEMKVDDELWTLPKYRELLLIK